MTFASSAQDQLRYITESVQGITPVAGNGVNLRMTAPTLKAQVNGVESKEIRADRLTTGVTNVDMNVDGGFNFELSGKEYDPFIESLVGNSFGHYGVLGLGSTFSATTTANSITAAVAPIGASALTNIGLGSWIKLVAPAAASQAVKDYFADKWFKTHASTAATATVVTLDASTPIAAPGLLAAVAGFAVSQSVVSNGSTSKTFTLEQNFGDIGQFLSFTGMRANTMDLDIQVGNIITGMFDFVGMGHAIQSASVLPGTPVAAQTLDPMNAVTDVGAIYEAGTSLLGSTSFIKSLKLKFSQGLRGQKAIGVYGNVGVGLGELKLDGTMEVYFQDATYYKKWLNNTATSLAIGLADSLGNGYLIELDRVQFKDGALNGSSKSEDVMLTLPFVASYNPATGRGLRITRAVAA
jgi:Phage tail tube protein